MKTAEDRIVVFDGNCRFCTSVIAHLTKWKWIDSTKTEPYYELSADKQAKVNLDHFRSEMAVIDMDGSETLYGLEGVLYATGYRFPFLRKIKRNSFIFPFMEFLYKNVAWNRYVIMRPISTIKCDCEPSLNKTYRLSLFAICSIIAVIITSLFGLAVGAHVHITPIEALKWALLAIGTGWVLQILFVMLLLRGEQLFNYLGHLGVIMLVGVLVLIPGLLFFWLPDTAFSIVMGMNVLCSSLLMLRMHYKRAASIGLSQLWTVSWFLFLQGGAIFWLKVFFLSALTGIIY
jgi:hypothetical protein